MTSAGWTDRRGRDPRRSLLAAHDLRPVRLREPAATPRRRGSPACRVDRIRGSRRSRSAALAAGLAGVIDTSRVLSAQANAGGTLAFTVLAGIVVGGTSILGGEGAVWRTVIGVLLHRAHRQRLQPARARPALQQITLGVILLLAVGLDAFSPELETLAG